MVERREYAQDAHLSAKNVNIVANARWVFCFEALFDICPIITFC